MPGALKYGRNTDDYTREKLDLTALVTSADFSMVPPVDDPLSKFSSKLLMLGNGPDPLMPPGFTGAGDCEAARVANNRLVLTGKYPAPSPTDVLKWVWEIYETQAEGFDPYGDPEVDGPGSPKDTGMSSDELLDHLHTVGTPDGVKVVAFGTIDPTNIAAVERAIAVSGGSVWIDILVQDGNQTDFEHGKPWVNHGTEPEGGHAVLGGGYTPSRRIATWAAETTLAESFWTAVVNGNALIERVYLFIWPEHITEEFLASESATTLAAQFNALTGKTLVWPTPVPTPTPVTPPVTPPSSQPDEAFASDAHAWLSHNHTGINADFAKSVKKWLDAKVL
jgi:hypothetical protein